MWYFWVSVTSPIGGLPWYFEPNCGIWLLASERKRAELLAFRRVWGGIASELASTQVQRTGSIGHWEDVLAFLRWGSPSTHFLIPLEQTDCSQGRNNFRTLWVWAVWLCEAKGRVFYCACGTLFRKIAVFHISPVLTVPWLLSPPVDTPLPVPASSSR